MFSLHFVVFFQFFSGFLCVRAVAEFLATVRLPGFAVCAAGLQSLTSLPGFDEASAKYLQTALSASAG